MDTLCVKGPRGEKKELAILEMRIDITVRSSLAKWYREWKGYQWRLLWDPDSQDATKRSNSWIRSLQHAVHGQSVLLLTLSLLFQVRSSTGRVLIINGFILCFGIVNLLSKLRLFVSKPLGNLLVAERKLARTVFRSRMGRGCLEGTSRAIVRAPRPGRELNARLYHCNEFSEIWDIRWWPT